MKLVFRISEDGSEIEFKICWVLDPSTFGNFIVPYDQSFLITNVKQLPAAIYCKYGFLGLKCILVH